MNIGIIGCGWLGKPLSTHLSHEHQTSCFSRTNTPPTFWENELFIISISTKDNYLTSLKHFSSKMNPSAKIIFISSTSIYKEFNEEVHEDFIISKDSLQKQAEDLILDLRTNVLILRLGGLMGDDRIAGKWKSPSTFADGPVNYIHQEDILQIISKFLALKIYAGIFNLVAPEHPLRSQVHSKNSLDFDFDKKSFEGMSQRTVSSDKLILTLNYKFLHPNPLFFWT